MKIGTFIKRYAKNNPTPDLKYCPDILIYWHGCNAEHGAYTKYYNPKTGDIKYNSICEFAGNFITYSARNYGLIGCYAKEIRKDIMEIAFVQLVNMKRGKQGEKREWKFHSVYNLPQRIFLDKELNAYDENGNEFAPTENGRYYNKKVLKILHEFGLAYCACTQNFRAEWNKFTSSDVRRKWEIENSYRIRRNKAKENPLTKMELPEIKLKHKRTVFNILNEDLAVFRLFSNGYNYTLHEYEILERFRIFVDKKGKVTIIENIRSANKWRVTSISNIYIYNYVDRRSDIEKALEIQKEKESMKSEMLKYQPLKYIVDIVFDEPCNSTDIVNRVISCLRHPLYEKLIKAGYKYLAKHLMQNREFKVNTKKMFDVDVKNEKGSINKLLSVNSNILSVMEKMMLRSDGNKFVLPIMRKIFGDKVNSLTPDDLFLYWNIINKVANKYGNYLYYLDPYAQTSQYIYRNLNEDEQVATEYSKKILTKLKKLTFVDGITRECNLTSVDLYLDSVQTYRRITNKPDIEFLNIKTEEDIRRIHDNLVALLNTERNMAVEERNKALKEVFEKKQKKRIEKFEKIGDKYEIIVPKNLSDITTEGQALSHCVGGYLESHARGDTNILFLRRTDLPNSPFYTIEVSNDNYVVQIHGKCNCWLGNNPDAIPFVYSWIKERNLVCEDFKLLDTSMGYGKSGNMLDEKYLMAA